MGEGLGAAIFLTPTPHIRRHEPMGLGPWTPTLNPDTKV